MPLLTWNDSLETGVKQFDDQHQKLVGMVNELFDGMQAGKGKETLGPVLDGLIAYTGTHFKDEERLMQQHGYPKLAAHQKEHADLVAKVVEVQQKYHAGASALLGMEVMNFLKNWLINHIQGTDKEYGPYFNSKGVE